MNAYVQSCITAWSFQNSDQLHASHCCHMHTYSGHHAGFCAHHHLSAYHYHTSCKALLAMPQLCGMQLLSAPTDQWKAWALMSSHQKQGQPSHQVSSATPMPMTTAQSYTETPLSAQVSRRLAPAIAITAQAVCDVASEAVGEKGHTNHMQFCLVSLG